MISFQRQFLRLICTLFICQYCSAQKNLFGTNRTPGYQEVISYYQRLDSLHWEARLIPYGRTDVGLPLQLFIISRNGVFDPGRLHELGLCVLFINNGIHPGEPDGINASMQLAAELLENPEKQKLLEHVVICIIPLYNIDGALQRGCCSRANQDGPEEYGFRGNAQNLDLNRDFIKSDASNTQSWIKIFRQWDPDVLIDTHVSDGADYQYSMTLISSQHDKLNPVLGNLMKKKLTPDLMARMKNKKIELFHYVDPSDESGIPDSGIVSFLETPRFITGYATLFNSFSFMAESHMLKPFPVRVKATHALLTSLLELCGSEYQAIISARNEAKKATQFQASFPLNWTLDSQQKEFIPFKGFQAEYKPSLVTGLTRLYFNHDKPFDKKIPFYDHYFPADSVEAPLYYVVPQAWHRVVALLELNHVRLITLREDSITTAEVYYIDHFTTTDYPYEGHYLHSNTTIRKQTERVTLRKGDFLVPVFQEANRYVVEALEPHAVDSYFNWGFFDAILQQKEWFSPYVFEDLAERLLTENPTLASELDLMRKANHAFAKDSIAQLNFIYEHSDYFEKSLNRYPVYRILKSKP